MKTYQLEKTDTHTLLFEQNPYNPLKKSCVGIFKNSPDLEEKLQKAQRRLEDHGMSHYED
jgi:hypothetical protein